MEVVSGDDRRKAEAAGDLPPSRADAGNHVTMQLDGSTAERSPFTDKWTERMRADPTRLVMLRYGGHLMAAARGRFAAAGKDLGQAMLANGIAEAMYNTALGLGIAVFCMITHILLHTRAKSIQHDLDSVMERTFNLLTLQRR